MTHRVRRGRRKKINPTLTSDRSVSFLFYSFSPRILYKTLLTRAIQSDRFCVSAMAFANEPFGASLLYTLAFRRDVYEKKKNPPTMRNSVNAFIHQESDLNHRTSRLLILFLPFPTHEHVYVLMCM